jgi:hypothetical protein
MVGIDLHIVLIGLVRILYDLENDERLIDGDYILLLIEKPQKRIEKIILNEIKGHYTNE